MEEYKQTDAVGVVGLGGEVIDYSGEERTDVATFRSKEAGKSFVQDTILQAMKDPAMKKTTTRKYVIRGLGSTKSGNIKKASKKEREEEERSEEGGGGTLNALLVTQLQLSNTQTQIGQSQLLSQLMDLKNSLMDTKAELNAKLREINGKIAELDLKTSTRSRSSGAGTSAGKTSPSTEEDEDTPIVDYSHLVPLKRETVSSLYSIRRIDEGYIRNILKGKNQSSFMKVFQIIYNSQKHHEGDFEDIYPIRVLKGRTFQYYVDGKWLHDTGGSVVIDIIVHNIKLLFTKVNSDYYASGDYDMSDFIDNQGYLETFDEKRFKTQMLSMIKDAITNHKTNR